MRFQTSCSSVLSKPESRRLSDVCTPLLDPSHHRLETQWQRGVAPDVDREDNHAPGLRLDCCPGTADTITGGSSVASIEGKMITRLGDNCAHGGRLAEGVP